MEYQTIFTIKESEKATVELVAMEGHIGPVIVKKLQGATPDIYRLLCHAQNSHLPQVYAVEEQGEILLIAEEYVDGENLEDYLEQRKPGDEEKLDLALQLCEAVEALHSMIPPVIHRDIKPSNILITGKGILKLIDFDASRQYKAFRDAGDTRLLGTVEYAPPEQFGYSQTDVRSDIYSMGVVFLGLQLSENKQQAERWSKLVEKCTSFDPKNRYQSVAELAREIEKLKNKKKFNVWKPAGLVGVLAVGMAAVLLSGMWMKPNRESEGDAVIATGTPMPELLPAPEKINQHFYPGLAEETELILRHSWGAGQKPWEWHGTCYNYADGTTVTVSQDMIDIGAGYIRILDEFLLTLEQSVYELTLYFYWGSDDSMRSTDRTLQVHAESEMLGSFGSPFSSSKDTFQVNNPQDFMNDISSSSTRRFTGVAVQAEGMDRETVEGEWYEILCDGKVLILKKEYLLQYAGVDKLILTYFFDDGRQYDFELAYEGNEDNG